jgi:hypothetical protein
VSSGLGRRESTGLRGPNGAGPSDAPAACCGMFTGERSHESEAVIKNLRPPCHPNALAAILQSIGRAGRIERMQATARKHEKRSDETRRWAPVVGAGEFSWREDRDAISFSRNG